MSFWNKKEVEEPTYQRKLADINDQLADLTRQMKQIRDDLEKMDIKVLESRKVYQRKLKNLIGDEEEQDMQETKGINNPVILPYNGSFK
jgi:hypothetical protein